MLKTLLLVAATLAVASPAVAQRNALPDPDAGRIVLEQAMRERNLRTAQEQERRLQNARASCIANRGVDCDSPQGLEEWLLLERSRSEAVLDRVAVPEPAGSASTGSSTR